MYYVIMGLPLAAVFAAVQFFLCEKSKSNFIKLLPVFCGAFSFLLAAFIRGENFIASAVYGIFGMGIFALVAILWILGIAFGAGSVIGWGIWIIKKGKTA